MFVLEVVEVKLKTHPDQFDRDTKIVLIEQIEMKYLNKVIHKVGLCVAFYDFLEIGDPYIYPSEGAAHQLVKFRLVVFRPFDGETIVGKIVGSSPEGLQVSLDFFDDVLIPSNRFMEPSTYDDSTRLWTWKYGTAPDEVDFVMEMGESVRFKVMSCSFCDFETLRKSSKASGLEGNSIEVDSYTPPMQVIGSIQDFGLGLTSWWHE